MINVNEPLKSDLEILLNLLKEGGWTKDTAYAGDGDYYKNKWTMENSSCGQCANTAALVKELFGGDIYSIPNHYFNLLNNEIVDLTDEQFLLEGNRKLPDYSKMKIANIDRYNNKFGESGNVKMRKDKLKDNLDKLDRPEWAQLKNKYLK